VSATTTAWTTDRPGFRCDDCGAIDFCYVAWDAEPPHSLCGRCYLLLTEGQVEAPPAWTVIA